MPDQIVTSTTARSGESVVSNAQTAQEPPKAPGTSSSAAMNAPPAPGLTGGSARKRSIAAVTGNSRKGGENREELGIRPARKFQKFVEYDFSKMTDTKGGFLSAEDDPHSTLAALDLQDKPARMSLEDWAKHQLRVKLIKEKVGPFEPAISAFGEKEGQKTCFDCGSLEIDWKWLEVFGCRVCAKCKEEKPDKYSLLTKTECRQDYLLTDPELKDQELLPHLEKPNPHKSTWNNMMLYLRYQVEAHALKKWGTLDDLDKEYEKRTAEKKRRKDEKFRTQLRNLKRKTRVESWKRGGGASADKHEHSWGTAVTTKETGETVKTCEDCGFEIEELVF